MLKKQQIEDAGQIKYYIERIARAEAERDAAKLDNDRLNNALNEISEKEFAHSGYNLPQMVRIIAELATLKAENAQLRQLAEQLTEALRLSHEALDEMCEHHGATHEHGCPEDDTCDCLYKPFNDRVNTAFGSGEDALASSDALLGTKAKETPGS